MSILLPCGLLYVKDMLATVGHVEVSDQWSGWSGGGCCQTLRVSMSILLPSGLLCVKDMLATVGRVEVSG